jgi:hypothetical protein
MYARIGIAIGAAALALAGCSTSTTITTSSSSASPLMSESPSSSTQVLPPVMIDGTKTSVDAKVGDTLDVTTKDTTKVSTDNATVLKVSQPNTEGSAEFNAGAEVLAAGTAKLVVSGSSGELYTVTVTATE